ncbi:MAG: NAD-dependent epimerase/dehydratase family protein [Candidatus Schekmanbacteria bacterium]|nr:MAG: NAD-dependent epimerase/dehydratase family protein [Candidatus Schekmanbacteria bacterium]
MKSALVTGGAGFIGSHIVDALIDDGFTVSIVDNLATGKERNINPSAHFYKIDIRDEKLSDVFDREKPDIVFHLAAQMDVRKSVEDPSYDADVNVRGAINLLENSKRTGVEKLLFSSTGGAIYGEPETFPVKEDHPIRPLSPYGLTKFVFENYLGLYERLYGFKYTVLRYPNVYGPRQDPHGEAGVVAIFSQQMLTGVQPKIFGDGNKTRDYVFIEDIVKANMICIEKGEGEILNLGWGKEVKDIEIFEAVRDAVGANVEPFFAEPRLGEIERISLDASKAEKIIGWKPTIPLKEGVRRAVEFYRNLLAK